MKKIILFFVCFCVIHCYAQFPPVAVVELFSSQGCSSCPAADKLLAKTIDEARKDGRKIFSLEYHVDYWNRLGWADPFSNKQFTQRQEKYTQQLSSSVYTPQMVVNGSTEFVGSNEHDLNKALTQALNTKASVQFKTLNVTFDNGVMKVNYVLEGDYAGCTINFALVSLSETTSVKRGENSGRTMTNRNVVRQLITEPAKAQGTITFATQPLPAAHNSAVIAFVQSGKDMKIIGASFAAGN